jgi:ribose 5-phosphate isomerase B
MQARAPAARWLCPRRLLHPPTVSALGDNRSEMRIAVAADEAVGIAGVLLERLRERGHELLAHGALSADERHDWAWSSEAAARDVAERRADEAIVCCWTGTGASIAANKVAGVRAALCADAATAAGARRWNDANALALSLRSTSEAELAEILDAWFAGAPSSAEDDRANVAHLSEIERANDPERDSDR